MSRIILVTSLVVFVAHAAQPAPAEEPTRELSGKYYCYGTDADGDGYRGVVQIGKHGDVYYLQWTFPSGLRTVGVGIVNGEVLAVSYYGRSLGVVLYEIVGSTLEGHWSDVGTPGRVFEEKLTPIADEPLDTEQPASPVPGIRL